MKNMILMAAILCGSAAYGQSPAEVFQKLEPTLQKYPGVTRIEICVPDGSCEVFAEFQRKAGDGPAASADPTVAQQVSDIIGQAGKATGVGGRVVVEYERTEKDGTKTKVKVDVAFGVGSGAPGASSSNPDTSDK